MAAKNEFQRSASMSMFLRRLDLFEKNRCYFAAVMESIRHNMERSFKLDAPSARPWSQMHLAKSGIPLRHYIDPCEGVSARIAGSCDRCRVGLRSDRSTPLRGDNFPADLLAVGPLHPDFSPHRRTVIRKARRPDSRVHKESRFDNRLGAR